MRPKTLRLRDDYRAVTSRSTWWTRLAPASTRSTLPLDERSPHRLRHAVRV